MIKNYIATDSSSLIRFLRGDKGKDVDLVEECLLNQNLILPPLVVTEILSEPTLSKSNRQLIDSIVRLPLEAGYWERAGTTRAKIFSLKLKTKIADALIAQSCIDNNVLLITYDNDFRHYAKHCGLKLA